MSPRTGLDALEKGKVSFAPTSNRITILRSPFHILVSAQATLLAQVTDIIQLLLLSSSSSYSYGVPRCQSPSYERHCVLQHVEYNSVVGVEVRNKKTRDIRCQ